MDGFTFLGELRGERYDRFLEQFGSDEFILVSLTGADVLEAPSLEAQIEVVEMLEGIDFIDRVSWAVVSEVPRELPVFGIMSCGGVLEQRF